MKYAVMGAGAVGGYFGARLAAGGDEVVFIARGPHREAMRRSGLKVLSPLGDVHIEAPDVMDVPDDVGLCDIVLFCVKLWDVAAAAETIKPLLARDCAVVPLQNGVTVEDQLSDILGAEHVMGGVCKLSVSIEAPGVIRHHGDFAWLGFGERGGESTWRQECLHAACLGAGLNVDSSRAIEADIWEKFVFLAPFAGATSFYRTNAGQIVADPQKRARFEAMVRETAAVGRAKGVALPADLEARTLAFVASAPPAMIASMANDLAAGRRLELDWLSGEVVRLGKELGVATPENAAVTEALEPYAMGQATVS